MSAVEKSPVKDLSVPSLFFIKDTLKLRIEHFHLGFPEIRT